MQARSWSRRRVLSAAALGVPAASVLALLGAHRAQAATPQDTSPGLPPYGPIIIDGYWGRQTTLCLQWFYRTPEDGVVSSQMSSYAAPNPGLVSSWDWVPDHAAQGSTVIKAMQERLNRQVGGVVADGLMGPVTIRALQRSLNQPVTGTLPAGSETIKALQRDLTWGRF